jgi:hypothetical protein
MSLLVCISAAAPVCLWKTVPHHTTSPVYDWKTVPPVRSRSCLCVEGSIPRPTPSRLPVEDCFSCPIPSPSQPLENCTFYPILPSHFYLWRRVHGVLSVEDNPHVLYLSCLPWKTVTHVLSIHVYPLQDNPLCSIPFLSTHLWKTVPLEDSLLYLISLLSTLPLKESPRILTPSCLPLRRKFLVSYPPPFYFWIRSLMSNPLMSTSGYSPRTKTQSCLPLEHSTSCPIPLLFSCGTQSLVSYFLPVYL